MKIVYRQRISIAHLPAHEIPPKLNALRADIETARDMILEDEMREEVFMTPSVFLRVQPIFTQLEDTNLSPRKRDGDIVGRMFNVTCRSPAYSRRDRQDLEGLADGQLEYRIVEG